MAKSKETLAEDIGEVMIRIRIGEHDSHYAGSLVDGAKMLQLFGDVATELLIRLDGDEGLFSLDRDAYNTAVQREVAEEMFIETPYTNHIVALLNDDSNEVGKVHLGVVHIFRLAEEKARKRESVITEAGFLPIAELRQRQDALETWSQFCIDQIDQLLALAK